MPHASDDARSHGGPLDRVTSLLDAMRRHDLDGVLDCFHPGPETYVYPEGPRWSTKGGQRVRQGWQGYFNAPIRLRDWAWAEGPDMHRSADLAVVAGVVACHFECNGQPRDLPLRMTWVLRPTGGVWRIVHEHGSQPVDDPYGTGDWLERQEPGT